MPISRAYDPSTNQQLLRAVDPATGRSMTVVDGGDDVAAIREMGLTGKLSAALPPRLAAKLVLAARRGNSVVVFFSPLTMVNIVNHTLTFPYSEDFPTDVDIARICVECP